MINAGALVDWEIMGKSNKGFTPSLGGFSNLSPFFAVRTETPDGEVSARILEGPVDACEYEGQSGSAARNHGFTRWRECTFKAAYPLAQVVLRDAAMPVAATLEAMNPMIPGKPVDVGNWYASRYPTAFAAAEDLLTNLSDYERETTAFVESVLARKAPAVVKEAALFNLSTLRTETCFRTADGHFFAWEGCFDREGVCEGSCSAS